MKTAQQIRHTLETNQAKEWGFKSIADANKNGYNVTRTSVTVKEVSDTLEVPIDEVRRMFNYWKNNEGGQISMCANLDCYYFIISM